MIFKVRRLGPVDQAEIDLSKDLILLTGPNGTGKTYVAWATYGFLRNLSSGAWTTPVRDALTSIAEGLLAGGQSEVDLPAIMREQGPAMLRDAIRAYVEQLPEDFAADKELFESTALEIDAESADWWENLSVWYIFVRKSADPSGELYIGMSSAGQRDDALGIPLDQIPREQRETLRDQLIQGLPLALSAAWHRPTILPAERIATTIFWRELSLKRTELVDELLTMEDQPENLLQHVRSRAQPYPRPIRDSLRMAGSLENWRRGRSEFGDLADYIEKHLLRGKVRLSQQGQLVFTPEQGSGVELGVHVTASMVKSLSLLVFYFRHMARPGDMLIIDEPELNLHPDNQRMIARVLARAANRGIKIMASTHSDYLIRELNNLIMLGDDTPQMAALRQKHGYEQAELLKPEQLGVYLFRGNTAEVVPVDANGFAIETIDAEIDRLNAVSQEIYAARLDQEP